MGFGTTGTSLLFLAAIVILVLYLAISKVDETRPVASGSEQPFV
jgi:uncharacterized membrane-anchored protein